MSSTAAGPRTVRFGDSELDLQSGELRRKGVIIRLPEQPFRILLLLLERPGEVVTREELRNRLWAADTFVDFDTGLNSAMRKLREALGDSAEHPTFIETLPRRGYRLLAPAVPIAALETPPDRQRPGFFKHKWAWATALAVAMSIVVIAALRTEQKTAVAQHRIESIAVLPLENLSGDPEQEHFADGMTDVLITGLAQVQALRVISRTSVMPYKKARKRLPEIARELNVDAIVEGTVVRSGARVRITAQLIHAATDQHLWAKSYERDMVDILSLQGELAQAIADAVEAKVSPQLRARLQSAPQLNPQASDEFYRGLVAANQQNADGYSKAIRHLQRAVTIQPGFALAHEAMARFQYQSAFFGPVPPREFMPQAEAAARRALKADPWLADGRITLANILYRYHRDWTSAEAEFRRALDLSPNDARAYRAYSVFLAARGRSEEAVAQREMARKVDPHDADQPLDERSGAPGDLDRAIAAWRKELARNPTIRAYFQLGSALVMNGQLAEGITALRASKPERHARYLAYLGYAFGASGDSTKARAILEELIARSRQGYVSSFAIAMVHMGLNERQAAIDRLERASQEHAFELSHLNLTPAFDSLRSDPRFRDLVERLGLPAAPL
jgi:TolB-like protein/DNA-binding winged helix-turn-helix (wHTH) protein/Tfp pilus assembly protein PilF